MRSIANPSLAYGELIIDFKSSDALVDNMEEIQDYLTAHYPDAYVKMKRYNLMFKKYPIEAQFLGPDPAVLHQLADSARTIMEHSPEVELITTDWDPQVPVLTVEYDQPAARSLGLSRNDVSLSLLTATSGIPIGSFYEGIHKDNIYLKCLDEQGMPINDLDNTQVFSSLPSLSGLVNEEMLVKLKSGTLSKEDLVENIMTTTPLKQVSKKVDIRWEDPVVPRYDGQRSQRVQCSPVPGIETEKARKACRENRPNRTAGGIYPAMARRKSRQHQIHEVPVQYIPVGHYPDDRHTHHVVQGLPQACHHLLLHSVGLHRCGSHHAHHRQDF